MGTKGQVIYFFVHAEGQYCCQSGTTMRFENILTDINGFGRFQIMIIAMNFLGRFTLPCHFMLTNFIGAVPDHHCDIGSLDDEVIFMNLSQEQKVIVSIPVQEDGSLSSCRMFEEPQYHLLFNSSNFTNVPTTQCNDGWVYDNTTFKSTITSEVISELFFKSQTSITCFAYKINDFFLIC